MLEACAGGFDFARVLAGGPGGDTVSIPTLQHGGLILLALLMAGLVWLRVRA